MKRLIQLYLLFFSILTFAQTTTLNKHDYILKLSRQVNPKRDSIRNLKLKEILTIVTENKKADTTTYANFDSRGNVLHYGDLTCRYDSSNSLTFLKFYSGGKSEGYGYDSIDFKKGIDTLKIYYALRRYNTGDIFPRKTKSSISDIKTTGLIDNTHLILPNQYQKNPQIIETYKYDFISQPPIIELIRYDTINNTKQSLMFYSTSKKNSFEYKLYNCYTWTVHNNFNEELYEIYTDIKDNPNKFPQEIEHKKFYEDHEEIYRYKKTLFRKKKLVEAISFRILYTYY